MIQMQHTGKITLPCRLHFGLSAQSVGSLNLLVQQVILKISERFSDFFFALDFLVEVVGVVDGRTSPGTSPSRHS